MSFLLLDLITALISLILLVLGAECMVRAAVDLGLRFRLSSLVIGLTIVAMATSAPEFAVSIRAAVKEAGNIALGNVFGSNLANVGLILGISALIRPLAVDRFSVRIDGPVMLAISIVGAAMAWTGQVQRWEGCLLLVSMIGYMAFRIQISRRTSLDLEAVEGIPESPRFSLLFALLVFGFGCVILAIGGDWLVRTGSSLALRLGIPEVFVAMTLVAVGTSLPELATSMVAAMRGHDDIAVGNILGSNIFNIAGVLGVSAIVRPISGQALHFELGAMLLLSALLLPLIRSGHRLSRIEGASLLAFYALTLVIASQ